MPSAAIKPVSIAAAPVTANDGGLDAALHPMHQALLQRWTDVPEPVVDKLSPLSRVAILLTGAAVSWAVVIGGVWGAAKLL